MKAQAPGPLLSTIFIDYDNIYLSLKRKNEDAAKRFAKDAGLWLREIESGRLITPTNGLAATSPRRIVMNRCYGNPVPRRNASDNATDMNSFPFVRHHFLRAGMEAVDCPPLTSQLKNSADIRMVMDVRDLLGHDTYFDEFIILSGDADFTPLLHRLRAHARRTVVFANDHTAAPYTAIADGEIREANLINLLLEGSTTVSEPEAAASPATPASAAATSSSLDSVRREILTEVVGWVKSAGQPVPLEALADRAVRTLGHDRTVGTGWAGAGSFSNLLTKGLPSEIRLSEQAPYYVFDASRQLAQPESRRAPLASREPAREPPRPESRFEREPLRQDPALPLPARDPRLDAPAPVAAPDRIGAPQRAPLSQPPQAPAPSAAAPREPLRQEAFAASPQQTAPQAPPQAPTPAPRSEAPSIQQSITRIHEACQAPPLAPPEYRALFEVMAQEINTNGLTGAQTLTNITHRAADLGVTIKRDDVRFVLEVVSESDPWFEQGASANLFASRFRNFVIARCRSQGLQLSAEELDLIDAWFGGSPMAQRPAPPQSRPAEAGYAPPPTARSPAPQTAAQTYAKDDRWWSAEEGRQYGSQLGSQDDQLPLIVRNRLRG
ncbi:MAG: NYN domain-containing protein [Hyphomicrobium sp.]|nr:NYN domain-containing protein [Hyphomicrobium sp.]